MQRQPWEGLGPRDPSHHPEHDLHAGVHREGPPASQGHGRHQTQAGARLPRPPKDYELDHLLPIGLGGHPRSLKNLWLQPWPEAATKDRDELRLHREVCAERMTLKEAQQEILAAWGPR